MYIYVYIEILQGISIEYCLKISKGVFKFENIDF